MRTVKVPCPGVVEPGGVFDPGDGAPAGTWNDGSDATFSVGDSACAFGVVPDLEPNPAFVTLTAHARYSGPAPGISVTGHANGNEPKLSGGAVSGGHSAVPTWSSVELNGTLDEISNFLVMARGGSTPWFLLIGPGGDGRIYEAHVIVSWSGGTPHPLRHYPRDDNVAGHVRRYPSTSFQRTRRRAGGYR